MGVGRKRKKNVWINEINDIIRGVCGGFLFGIPLLYTMEVWWIGSLAKPSMIMLAIERQIANARQRGVESCRFPGVPQMLRNSEVAQ